MKHNLLIRYGSYIIQAESGGKVSYMKAPRYMKSLKALGLKMYPKYSRSEKLIYHPNRVN